MKSQTPGRSTKEQKYLHEGRSSGYYGTDTTWCISMPQYDMRRAGNLQRSYQKVNIQSDSVHYEMGLPKKKEELAHKVNHHK